MLDALICRDMVETDLEQAVSLYMEYYNTYEEGEWTPDTTFRRIHQVWSREDSLCMVLERQGVCIGIALGYLEQYADLQAYDLVEIVIAGAWQNQGIGTWFMGRIEEAARTRGAAMVQLQAVNDEKHEKFYGKLQYKTCTNLILKAKWLS